MRVRFADPPKDLDSVVHETLTARTTASNRVSEVLSRSWERKATLATAAQHPVFSVGLQDLSNNRLVEAALQIGWRCVVLADDRAIMTAFVPTESLERAPADEPKTAQLTVSDDGKTFLEGLQRAESIDTGGEDIYGVRLLEILPLQFTALWLHGPDDAFLPLGPRWYGLRPCERVPEERLLSALRDPAMIWLEFGQTSLQ